MPSVVQDLSAHLKSLLAQGVSVETIVVVEEDPRYPGELVFQVVKNHEAVFYSRYQQWVSCYLVLSEIFNLSAFQDQLEADGYTVVYDWSCAKVLADYERWSEPLEIEGYELRPYQEFSLRRAFETDLFFLNWAVGAGKSYVCAAGAKELFRRGDIDLVLAFTVSKSKENLRRFFESADLDAVVNDGSKDKRRKGYARRHQTYVANYEKLSFDQAEILEMVRDLRVLFVFDEAHKIVTSGKQNNARKAFDKLWLQCAPGSKIWPMSASVLNGDPLKYRDTYSLGTPKGGNPLGSKAAFERRYAREVNVIPMKTKRGRRFELVTYDWDLAKLQEIRHRVGGYTHAVRQSDPGVASFFKDMATVITPVQFSQEERRLADFIIDKAYEAYQKEESLGPYYHLLRATAVMPQALLHSQSEVAKELLKEIDFDVSEISSTKVEVLNDQLESIRGAQDKTLVFCRLTHLGLHLVAPQLTVPYVLHYGAGQSNKESQKAQDLFQSDPDITCFLTSDAGTHGLNMQVSRYVVQLEPTYSFDDSMQRAGRINRSDSYLEGLANFVYVVEDSVEERVLKVNNARRAISAAVQGTEESFSQGDIDRELALRSEAENMRWLIFGDV